MEPETFSIITELDQRLMSVGIFHNLEDVKIWMRTGKVVVGSSRTRKCLICEDWCDFQGTLNELIK